MTPKEQNTLNLNNLAIKGIGVLGTIVLAGFTWWMTTVWNAQCAQADEISSMKVRLAALEIKVDSIDGKVNDVKSGVDTLVKIALKKSTS